MNALNIRDESGAGCRKRGGMWFRVTVEVDEEVLYGNVHEADNTEAALQDAMRVARKGVDELSLNSSRHD